MPTLTVSVDLPDDAYRKAALMSPGEQNRVASIALTAAFVVAEPTSHEEADSVARLARDADESAAFYAQLSDGEKAERRRIVEAGSAAGDAGRVVDADALFARVRARHRAAEKQETV